MLFISTIRGCGIETLQCNVSMLQPRIVHQTKSPVMYIPQKAQLGYDNYIPKRGVI